MKTLLIIATFFLILNYSVFGNVFDNVVDNMKILLITEEEVTVHNEEPTVEIVFVLDATGSMSSLIEGAKRKIWAIANKIVTGEPTPNVKIGLIVYRDRGDNYLVKHYDLTDDIDRMYNNLIAVQAQGGGDFREDVNMALHYAVDSISWSDNDNTLKMIFLVGDADPHMDYNDEQQYPEICKKSIENDILINTIRCGSNNDTERVWKEIAHLAEGHYTSIDYSTSQEIATPYDEELSELSSELYATVLVYGKKGARDEVTTMLEVNEHAADISMSTSADRAINAAARGGSGGITGGDLLGGIIEGKIKLEDLSEEELPEELIDLSEEERQVYIDSLKTEREEIAKRISELSKERERYIEENTTDEDTSFDSFVIEMLKEEAEKINVKYED